MMMTPEDRIAQLEKLVRDLTARVNRLEYASMRYGGPTFTPGTIPDVWPQTLPVTCKTGE